MVLEEHIVDDCGAQVLTSSRALHTTASEIPTGKLYKRLLEDRYWSEKNSRIV